MKNERRGYAAPASPPDYPAPQPQSTRESFLREAIQATVGDRNEAYGDPVQQLGLAGELCAHVREANNQFGKRMLTPAEWNAIDFALTKISRICTGAYRSDNYIDGAAYLAIAGECAYRGMPTETKP